MGTALYVCSTASSSGKSAVCVGIAHHLLRDGLSVGYMKPVSMVEYRAASEFVEEDVDFVTSVFGLKESLQDIAPIVLTPQVVDSFLRERIDRRKLLRRFRRAYRHITRDRDIVLMEGVGTLGQGSLVGMAPLQLVRRVKARALVVIRYKNDLQAVEDALIAHRLLGRGFLGLLFNAVPFQFQEFAAQVITPFLLKRGVRVYGMVPEERFLEGISVAEAAAAVDGEILCAEEHQDEIVENLMVGAMSADAALRYFRRTPNKAVVTGGDRLDIQLAALETSTRCLILTGGLYPSSVILTRAEEVGVPIILARQDTLTAVELIQRFMSTARFRQPKKIEAFLRILNENFDFTQLYKDLGLVPRASTVTRGHEGSTVAASSG